MIDIRIASSDDFEQIWPIFRQIISRGDTYAFDPDTSKEQAKALWMDLPRQTYVCELDGEIAGTYYIKTNPAQGGAQVCNCGYMVSEVARGKGPATAMCLRSQEQAVAMGYTAMQFNFVVMSNTGAIALWEKLGFKIVGRSPNAFDHPQQGEIDALVMRKQLMPDG